MVRINKLASQIGLCLLLVTVLGCGYALVGMGNNIPDHIESIYIAPLVNETTRAQVDQLLTFAITEEFVTRKQFKLVSSPEEADGVLEGTVLLFTTTPRLLDEEGRGTEYELTINVRMSFHDPNR